MPLDKERFTLIKDVVMQNEKPFFDKINNLVDKVITIVVENTDYGVSKTLHNLKDNTNYTIFYSGCNHLFRQKFYINVSNTKNHSIFEESSSEIYSSDTTKISFDNSNKKKLISYNTLIHFFWDYYNDIMDYIIDKIVDIEVPALSLHYFTHVSKFFMVWLNAYIHFWDILRVLLPIIEYIYLNYPNVSQKYVSRNNTLHNYFNKKFHNAMKNKLNETDHSYEDCLKYCIQGLLNEGTFNDTFRRMDTPLRFAYLFKETIEGKPIREYVFKQCRKDTLSKHKLLFRKGEVLYDTIQTFVQFLSRDLAIKVTVASMFSPTWMEPIKNMIVETTLMNKNIVSRYYYFFRDSFNFSENDDNDKSQNGYMGIFRFAFLTRGKTKELDQICSDIIYDEISKLYNASDKTSLIKVFGTLFFQIKFFSRIKPVEENVCTCSEQCVCYSENGPEYIRRAYIKLFGNETNLVQAIVTYIQTIEKSYIQDSIDLKFFFSNFKLLLKRLSIPSIITSLYSKHLFRYILMNYNSLIESNMLNLDDTMHFISNIVMIFNDVYTDSVHNLISMWRNFEDIVMRVSKAKEEYNDFRDFNPLILPQLDIPEMYQRINDENSLKNVRLPGKIREMWEKFEKDYKEVILKNGEHKVVHPLYGLQYCSVETPFMREDGTPLLLELTLYQTCVLNEFNEADKISFRDLVERLQMDGANVKGILNSFLNVGVIKMNKDKTFSVNEEFKADERKMKNGTLRVAMGKRLRKPLGESSHAVTDNGNNEEGMKEAENREGRSEEWNEGHHEGLSSVWKREVIKACIVRTVKSHVGRDEGISEEDLLEECLPQLLQGTSVGEFKDALTSAVRERYIKRTNNGEYIII